MTTLNSPSRWVLLWKTLPSPLRLCLRPWLVLSLALHGLWLLIPMPSAPPPVLEIPEEEQVSLTDRPTVSRPLRLSPSATPTPNPSPVVSVAPSPPPVAIASPIAIPAAPAVIPVVPPSPTPAAVAPVPSPSPAASPDPAPATPDVAQAEVSPLPEESPPATPWSTFPHPTDIATCDGMESCWIAPQSRWQQLFRDFEQSLQAEGYVLTDITEQRLSNTAGRRIFAIEKDNEPQYYLNMVSTSDGSTRYLNTEEPLSEAELNQLSGF